MKHLNDILMNMSTQINKGLNTLDDSIKDLPNEYKAQVIQITQMIQKGIATQDKALLEEAIKRSNTLKDGLNNK